MRGLERSGALEILNERGLGRVLDVIIGARLDMGDVNGAFRGERIARLMEVRLGRGTYARLIERCGDVGMGLGILHRAVGVGVVPNGRMWNCVLEMCVRERDGCRARAVLRELREMGAVNGETRRILLEAARDAEAVAEVRGVAGGGGDVAVAFARVGDWKACFEEVELGVNREHLEMIIRLACGGERMEVACRAWREMRRAWMGAPEGRTRRMLVWKLTVRGGYRDAELVRRLVTEAKECVTE